MSHPRRNGKSIVSPVRSMRFRDFEVSWASANPYLPGFCFGSADGCLLFTDEEGTRLSDKIRETSPSGEAINGVAYLPMWFAVSTRADVNLLNVLPGASKAHTAVFPAGAHGVIATRSGHFIVPLGRSGLLVVKPAANTKQSATLMSGTTPDSLLYIYSVISLNDGDREVLACAGRAGGMAAMDFTGEDGEARLSTIAFSGLDVVDICALRPDQASLAAAALDKSGTIVLSSNIRDDKRPLTLRFAAVDGIGYRVLSCRGDIYLLTSKGVYFFPKLADRFLNGELFGAVGTKVIPIPLQAIDMSLGQDRWLLVVMLDEVRRYDVQHLHHSASDFIARGKAVEQQPNTVSPRWKTRRIVQKSKQLLPSG